MTKTSMAKVRQFLVAAVLTGSALAGVSCGGSDTLTKGGFCSQISTVTCDRAQTCTLITAAERTQCINEAQAACCGDDMTCGDKPDNATQEMQLKAYLASCSNAIKTFSCTSLAAGDVPTECTTLAAASPLKAAAGQLSSSALSHSGAAAGQLFSAAP